jgi:hypothetical protein
MSFKIKFLKIRKNWSRLEYQHKEFHSINDLLHFIKNSIKDDDVLTLVIHIEKGGGEGNGGETLQEYDNI